jgi:hypothetical protein
LSSNHPGGGRHLGDGSVCPDPAAAIPRRSAVHPDATGACRCGDPSRFAPKNYSLGEAIVCSIPLREVPVPKNLEPMPVRRPPADLIDNMPVVSARTGLPEEKR